MRSDDRVENEGEITSADWIVATGVTLPGRKNSHLVEELEASTVHSSGEPVQRLGLCDVQQTCLECDERYHSNGDWRWELAGPPFALSYSTTAREVTDVTERQVGDRTEAGCAVQKGQLAGLPEGRSGMRGRGDAGRDAVGGRRTQGMHHAARETGAGRERARGR